MKTLVIDRDRWIRGEGSLDSALLRAIDGKMCCLGFYLESCGIPREKLRAQKSPSSATVDWGGAIEMFPQDAEWLVDRKKWLRAKPSNSDSCMELMIANDDDGTGCSLSDREANISRIFAAHGVEVTFVGGE